MLQKKYINDSVAARGLGAFKHDDWKICPLVELCVKTDSASSATTPFMMYSLLFRSCKLPFSILHYTLFSERKFFESLKEGEIYVYASVFNENLKSL